MNQSVFDRLNNTKKNQMDKIMNFTSQELNKNDTGTSLNFSL